jgi:poly-gamma-glutamate synthesis protein (capsule biosynthesis protein)
VIAVGDVMVGRGAGPKPFDHARPWLRAADVVVGNLESVIVGDPEACLSGSACEGPQFLLQAPPSAVAQLRDAGFNVLGLANNHALDLGPEGLEETASRLQTAHIAVIGAGRDGESALHPLVREVRGLRLAFLAFNALSTPQTNTQSGGWTMATWNQDRVAAAVAAVKDRVDAVVVSVHWGYEYETRVDPAQRDAAQALLEAGADLVIGHHPHVAQTFEIDERRVVAFSLGNFVFDQQQGETRRGLALRAFFDDDGLRAVQAIPVWAGPHPRLMTP